MKFMFHGYRLYELALSNVRNSKQTNQTAIKYFAYLKDLSD